MSDSNYLESYDEMTIAYKSQEGEISLRRILPLEYYSIGDKNYVRAFCYLKQAERTFRLDRIISINSVPNTKAVLFINDMPLNNSEPTNNIIKSKLENNITFNAPIPYTKPLYKSYETKEEEKKPFNYIKLLLIAFCMFFVLKCYNDQHTPTSTPTPTQVNKPAILTSTPVVVEKKTMSLPETKTVYHGYRLWLYKNGDYTEAVVPRFGMNRLKLQDAYAKINEAWVDFDGKPLPDGNYIPIDYNHVGSLSNAVGKGWLLKTIYRSETLYGETM